MVIDGLLLKSRQHSVVLWMNFDFLKGCCIFFHRKPYFLRQLSCAASGATKIWYSLLNMVSTMNSDAGQQTSAQLSMKCLGSYYSESDFYQGFLGE